MLGKFSILGSNGPNTYEISVPLFAPANGFTFLVGDGYADTYRIDLSTSIRTAIPIVDLSDVHVRVVATGFTDNNGAAVTLVSATLVEGTEAVYELVFSAPLSAALERPSLGAGAYAATTNELNNTSAGVISAFISTDASVYKG